jgi:type II secretory pathway component GspD/PulD (secretin)
MKKKFVLSLVLATGVVASLAALASAKHGQKAQILLRMTVFELKADLDSENSPAKTLVCPDLASFLQLIPNSAILHVLSRPSIRTLDGQQATIEVSSQSDSAQLGTSPSNYRFTITPSVEGKSSVKLDSQLSFKTKLPSSVGDPKMNEELLVTETTVPAGESFVIRSATKLIVLTPSITHD